MLSEEEIERNVQGIKRILEQLIASGNGTGPAPLILNNLVSQQRHCTQACDCCSQIMRGRPETHSSQPFIAARLQLLPSHVLQCSEKPVLTCKRAIRPMMPARGARSAGGWPLLQRGAAQAEQGASMRRTGSRGWAC